MKIVLRVICLIEIYFIGFNLSCDIESIEEEGSSNGCDFEALMLVNPQTGFTIAGDNCGLEVDKRTFEDQPYVFYPSANEDLKYALIMVDNDDPFTEDENQFLQWMVVDIDGMSLTYGVGEFIGQTVAGNQKFEYY